MTLDECAAALHGRLRVVYRPWDAVNPDETGVITEVDPVVRVRYTGDQGSRATNPERLSLAGDSR